VKQEPAEATGRALNPRRKARQESPSLGLRGCQQGTVYSVVEPGTGYHDIQYIRLAGFEGAEVATATLSGMAAVTTALLSVMRAGEQRKPGNPETRTPVQIVVFSKRWISSAKSRACRRALPATTESPRYQP
jgi:cystathionine beta-lyase/cystathionine gamma-synthase